MSWGIRAVGNRAHLHEQVRRHAHHYWHSMPADERGAAEHVLGHAINSATRNDAEGIYVLDGTGHSGADNTNLGVRCDRLWEAPPVPDPVAEAPVVAES